MTTDEGKIFGLYWFGYSIHLPIEGTNLFLFVNTELATEVVGIFIWAAPNEFGTYRLCEQRSSGEPAHPRSLARTFAVRSYKQWIKRNLQTESQIPGSSEWLGMRSWNLSWRNARRHKFAWRGPINNCLVICRFRWVTSFKLLMLKVIKSWFANTVLDTLEQALSKSACQSNWNLTASDVRIFIVCHYAMQ